MQIPFGKTALVVLLLLCSMSMALGSAVGDDCSGNSANCNTAGQFCELFNTCQLAYAGFYATGNGDQQVPGAGKCASAGSGCSTATGSTETFECTSEKYQPDANGPVTACLSCDSNAANSGAGSAGTCMAGYYGTASASTCTACPADTYKVFFNRIP